METLRHRETGADAEMGGIIFFNPNIHPLLEFRRRVKALRLYLERDPLQSEIDDAYGLPEFLRAVLNPDGSIPEREERCYRCYMLRLGKAAAVAAAKGAGAFSSTLLASREQDRDLVAEAGKEAGRRQGIRFVRMDLRQLPPPEKLLRGIYKQQYCGCIFSEEERYRNTNKHIYRLGGDGADDESP
jgi:predicted adenine nucleotide alpha hydrolase (AANH) superfamily ATPase